MIPMVTIMALAAGGAAEDSISTRHVLELRTYHFESEEKLERFAAYAQSGFIPALNRAGLSPVGVFRLLKADNPKLQLEADSLDLTVLIPHPDSASVFSLPGLLAEDPEAAAAAQAVLGTPLRDPVYRRFESQLLLAFTACPSVEVPTSAPERLLQLRIYESHNGERALRKIEMFNAGGEIALFRKVGLNPVFFGQSLAGTLMPNLTYMLGFKSQTAMDAAWGAFLKHPEWKKLSSDPRYAETVSRITNLILRPLPGSQI